MYIGRVALEGTLTFFHVTKDGSRTPTSPTGSVPYRVYGPNPTTTMANGTGNMTTNVDTYAYQCKASISCTSANGYASGSLYTIVVEPTVSGAVRGDTYYFEVY